MTLDVRIGTVPILWNNDDVPELTPPVPYERVLDEMSQAGFEGTELGSNYPSDPAVLRRALDARKMVLSGGYFCADYRDPARHAKVIAQAEEKVKFLAAAGAQYLVVADQIHPERSKVAGRVKPEHALSDQQLRAYVDVLNGIARLAQAAGLQAVFHNHAGSYVETPAELDRLMDATDPALALCLDTGHYTFGGGKPVEAIRKYGARLRYLHLKDIDGEAFTEAMRAEASFLDCLRRRVFTEIGRGMLDLKGIVAALRALNYRGWIVCEQDTGNRAPRESARMSRENLRAALAS